ncbi:MAG: AgmX/PglI C-terminal domain-containing protein [Agarilytica sp.]
MSAISMNMPYAIDLHLPWEEDKQQQEKFERTLKRVVVPLLLLFLIMPFLPTVDPDFEERELDIVKTEIVLKPVIIEPEPTPPPPKPQPKTAPKKPLQKKTEKPKTPQQKAKEKEKKKVAEAQGLAAISSELSALRQTLDLKKLQQKNVSTSKSGNVAREDSTVLGQDRLSQKSQGINVDDDMLRNKSVALAQHTSTTVDGFVEDGSPDVDVENFYSDLKGIRSTESIRRVFEAGKSRTNLNYQRELRNTPGLSGTFIFECVIQADGKISNLKLISSELNHPELEQKILATIKKFDFGAEDVSARKIVYKFNFVPS